jgi:hypothetical protein
VVECGGLENRCASLGVPRVRIPPPPLTEPNSHHSAELGTRARHARRPPTIRPPRHACLRSGQAFEEPDLPAPASSSQPASTRKPLHLHGRRLHPNHLPALNPQTPLRSQVTQLHGLEGRTHATRLKALPGRADGTGWRLPPRNRRPLVQRPACPAGTCGSSAASCSWWA